MLGFTAVRERRATRAVAVDHHHRPPLRAAGPVAREPHVHRRSILQLVELDLADLRLWQPPANPLRQPLRRARRRRIRPAKAPDVDVEQQAEEIRGQRDDVGERGHLVVLADDLHEGHALLR